MQDLEESRRLRDGEMILRIRNGARVAVVAVETYPLRLLLGLDLVLRDCYYVLAANRNLIFVSCLAQEGYTISFHKDHCNIKLQIVFLLMVSISHILMYLYFISSKM